MKIYETMENMAFKLRSETLYLRLKELIDEKDGIIIKTYDRGIGKTYNLARLSEEYDIPLIVNSSTAKQCLLRSDKGKFKARVICQDEVRGFYFKEGVVLVDEYRLMREDTIRILNDHDVGIIAVDTRLG